MIYFLHGPDTYRSFKKLQQIKQRYLKTSGDTDLAMLEGETLTVDEFRRQVQTLPFLAKNRLVIVRDLLTKGKKEVADGVVTELAGVPSSTVLFFYETGKPDGRSKLFTALDKPKQAEAFDLLTGPALSTFIKKLAEEKDLALNARQPQLLAERLGSDLWLVDGELEKLALFASQPTKEGKIEDADIEALTLPKTGLDSVFALTDALGARDSKLASKLLALVDPEESGHGLLSLVAGHYRNMILVADALERQVPRHQLAKHLSLHPFVAEKIQGQLRQYSFVELRAIYRFLLDLDIVSKQSILEPLFGLKALAACLAKKPLVLPDITEENVIQ